MIKNEFVRHEEMEERGYEKFIHSATSSNQHHSGRRNLLFNLIACNTTIDKQGENDEYDCSFYILVTPKCHEQNNLQVN
jgi:hypothetical protein